MSISWERDDDNHTVTVTTDDTNAELAKLQEAIDNAGLPDQAATMRVSTSDDFEAGVVFAFRAGDENNMAGFTDLVEGIE